MGLKRDLPAVAASAALFYFGTGLTPVALLAWMAPLPMLVVARRTSAGMATGGAFAAALLGTSNSWAFQLRSHDTPMVPVGLMIDVGMSLVFALTVWVFRRLSPWWAVVTAPAVWTGALYVVSISNPMGIMGTLVNHQGDVPLVLQVASLTGMWGVEYLVMLVPCAIAVVKLRTTAVLLAVVLIGGALRPNSGPTQTVAAIATNQRVWAPDLDTPQGQDLVNAYAQQINALPAEVTTVVLPEQTVRSSEARPAALTEALTKAANGRNIVVGLAQDDGKAKYNLALTFPAQGAYLKHHDTVSPPGHELVFAAPGIGVEICADVNHPDPSRDYARAGARLLAIPASDEDANGWQHSRMALIRGVENGQAVVWAGRTGEVMISDGWGRVLASAHTGGDSPFTTVIADVPLGPGATLYSRLGDWFAWLCLALVAAALVQARRSHRATGHGPAARPMVPRDGLPAQGGPRTSP
jgi:apolipoprotein N-acyltransferase